MNEFAYNLHLPYGQYTYSNSKYANLENENVHFFLKSNSISAMHCALCINSNENAPGVLCSAPPRPQLRSCSGRLHWDLVATLHSHMDYAIMVLLSTMHVHTTCAHALTCMAHATLRHPTLNVKMDMCVCVRARVCVRVCFVFVPCSS